MGHLYSGLVQQFFAKDHPEGHHFCRWEGPVTQLFFSNYLNRYKICWILSKSGENHFTGTGRNCLHLCPREFHRVFSDFLLSCNIIVIFHTSFTFGGTAVRGRKYINKFSYFLIPSVFCIFVGTAARGALVQQDLSAGTCAQEKH